METLTTNQDVQSFRSPLHGTSPTMSSEEIAASSLFRKTGAQQGKQKSRLIDQQTKWKGINILSRLTRFT